MGSPPFPLPEGQAGILPRCGGEQLALPSLGGQLETSQLPGPKSGDIKLTLPSSGPEAGAKGATGKWKGATGKRKGSRQNLESSC